MTEEMEKEELGEDAKAHYNLGKTYEDQGRLDDAIKEYHEAIRIKPDYACAYCRLGTAYSSKGELDSAIAEYKKAIEIKPDCAEVHYILGIRYANQGNPAEAIEEYKVAININPNHAEAHNNLGNIYKEQGKLEEAIKEYRTAISANPDLPQPHRNMAEIHKDKGELDDAIREYQEIIRIEPEGADSHHFLGHVYFDKNMFNEAIAEWKKTIELAPDDARLYKDLRNVYFKAGKLDELIEETEQKLEADPGDARGYYLLALALAEKWEYERAIENFRKAIELDPSYEPTHEDYIEFMKGRGRDDEARAEYKKKAEAQPDSELWRKLLERLPAVKKRLLSTKCALCIGRGVFKLIYILLVLLTGISAGIAFFTLGLTSSPYPALMVYIAIISAIYGLASAVLFAKTVKMVGEVMQKIGDKETRLAKLIRIVISIPFSVLVSLRYVPIAILAYASMQIFHANWWVAMAVLFVLFRIVFLGLASLGIKLGGKPLEDPMLTERLTALIKRSNVRVKGILRVDTDKLPSALVLSKLRPKRILLNSSILKRFSIPEIEAVFAHELGHIKIASPQRKLLVQFAPVFVRFYLANLIYGILLSVFGFSDPGQISGLPLLAFCWIILGPPFRVVQSFISKYYEKKADQYAISMVGRSPFLSAFGKILPVEQRRFLSSIIALICGSHPCKEKRLNMP